MERRFQLLIAILPFASWGFVNHAGYAGRAIPQIGAHCVASTHGDHDSYVSAIATTQLPADSCTKQFSLSPAERETVSLLNGITSISELETADLHAVIARMHPYVASQTLKTLVNIASLGDSALNEQDYYILLGSMLKSISDRPSALNATAAVSAFLRLDHKIIRDHERAWITRKSIWESLSSNPDRILEEVPARRLAKFLQQSSEEHESGVNLCHTPLYGSLCLRLQQGDALDQLSMNNMYHILRKISLSSPFQSECRGLVQGILNRVSTLDVYRSATTESLVRILSSCRRLKQLYPTGVKSAVLTLSNHLFSTTLSLSTYQSTTVLECVMLYFNEMPDFVHKYCTFTEDPLSISQFAEAVLQWKSTVRGRQMIQRLYADLRTHSDPKPDDVTDLLRVVGLLFSRDMSLVNGVFESVEHHCVDKRFLAKCKDRDVANVAWFLAVKARHVETRRKTRIAQALARHLLNKEDDSRPVSPKIAIRILSSLTVLFPNPDNSEEVSNIYEKYQERIMQSDKLHTNDITSAMVAFAKRSAVCNTTIFEHLSKAIASTHQVKKCSSRQAAQALWACGKLADRYDRESNPNAGPALDLLRHLIENVNTLGPLDVSQSIWALARLGVRTDDMVVLTNRARSLNEKLKATEVANIVWGISKLRVPDFKTVFVLTRRFCRGSTKSLAIKPEEASSILYALGRLDIRDEDVFRVLTESMLSRAEDTNAQAITNVIWAYQNVHIRPPTNLLQEGMKLRTLERRIAET